MRVAVIGGGAAGTCVVDALVRFHDGRAPVHATVFEASKQYGPGRAFQLDSAAALMNQPAVQLSLRDAEPDHFLRWLTDQGHAAPPGNPHTYVPRALFGRYLEDCFKEAVHHGRTRRVRVRTRGRRVVALRRTGTGFAVRTDDAGEHHVDRAVVCTGSSEPVDLYGLSGSPGFVADPYPLRVGVAGCHRDDAVTVLGTGLSAVDVVLELARHGHRGPLRMVSRGGLLPGVRNPAVPVHLRICTPTALRDLAEQARHGGGRVTLRRLWDLVARELQAQGLPPQQVVARLHRTADPHEWLRQNLAAAQSGERWPAVLTALTHGTLIEDAWALLDDRTRQELHRDWHTLTLSLCAPMPIPSARTLVSLVDTQQLEILAGVRQVAAQDGGGYRVACGPPGADTSHHADVVINTVRPRHAAVPHQAVELFDSLEGEGLATAHPFGGVRIHLATNRLLDAEGRPVPHLYALGQPAVGELYLATTGLSAIVRRAENTAAALLHP